MRKYIIKIEETLSKLVTVEAENEEQALVIVQKNYDKADDDYILSADNWEKTEVFIQ